MAEYMKKIVYLTEEQKNILFANGSITVGGKTITYDPNDVYVTPRDLPDFQVGTVETLPAGSQATASITGTGDTPVINLGIPKGDQGIQGPQGDTGDTGLTPDFQIGTVSTLPAGSSATATITGTDEQPILNLGIPQGIKGDMGNQGETGLTPDLSVGAVSTLPAGSSATVTITGTDEEPVLNFGIPQGAKGDTGETGATPDFTIGTVSTLPAGSSATASITGTAEDPVLNLGIPKGDTGEVTQAEFDALASDVTNMQDTLEHKADIDGYYTDMTVGNAEQLVASQYVEDAEPYKYRTSGGSADIGNRAYVDKIVGGTVAWNQQVRDEESDNVTDYADVVTVTDAIVDDAAVSVNIEPVQDLHGYDSPWPAGGGANQFDALTWVTLGSNANYYTVNANESITVTANDTGGIANRLIDIDPDVQYSFMSTFGQAIRIFSSDSQTIVQTTNGTFTAPSDGKIAVKFYASAYPTSGQFILVKGSTIPTAWSPYSNICPISGWDEVNVTRTGKNLFDINGETTLVHETIAIQGDKIVISSIGSGATSRVYFANEYKAGTYTMSAKFNGDINTVRLFSPQSFDGGTYNAFYGGYYAALASGEITVTFAESFTIGVIAQGLVRGSGDIYDMQLEFGSTATAYEPYQSNTYTITLPTSAGTVYGGNLTVNKDGSGSLVVDRANIASYNGETLPSTWISDRDVYAAGTTPTIGAQVVYMLATPLTYTLTASQITTLLGTNNVWSDAGQLSLTYTGTDEHLTLTTGRKYLTRINGTDSMVLGAGQTVTAAKGTDNVFDLTQMFGTSVADYVYQQGASYFRKWFGETWYEYNAGELISVEGLQSRDVVGFNCWDEEWELGQYDPTTGEPMTATNAIRSKNYIHVISGATYCSRTPTGTSGRVFFYDGQGTMVGTAGVGTNATFTIDSGVEYIKFHTSTGYGTTYNHDICINLSWSGTHNGEYQPYEKHSYPLDSGLTLRGIPKVGSNGVYWDGDEYGYDGTVKRRYGVVDLGTLDYAYYNYGIFYSATLRLLAKINGEILANGYTHDSVQLTNPTNLTMMLAANGSVSVFRIVNTAYTDAAAFKASLSGVYLIYELATPTTDETATPFQHIQHVDDWGTEELVSDTITPVGHLSKYMYNLRDKLQHLPDLAGSDGKYIISQSGSDMTLVPYESGLPTVPSANGSYVLKCTVTNGAVSYSWVAS